MTQGKDIMFYDGDCGLCSRLVQFVLEHDDRGQFHFAALQGEHAHRTLPPLGGDPAALNTFYVLRDAEAPQQGLLSRGRAARYVARELGGGWKLLASLGFLVPGPLLDVGYDFVAKRRHRWFGKGAEVCILPTEEQQSRFLDGL